MLGQAASRVKELHWQTYSTHPAHTVHAVLVLGSFLQTLCFAHGSLGGSSSVRTGMLAGLWWRYTVLPFCLPSYRQWAPTSLVSSGASFVRVKRTDVRPTSPSHVGVTNSWSFTFFSTPSRLRAGRSGVRILAGGRYPSLL